jgi:glycosyltransferase involved in cell wall biosynthesis
MDPFLARKVNMMNEKVSIVIPVYRIAAYIGDCVESLLAQSYENLEIILVDDGGKDESGAICDRYAAQDPRIRVIHKENGGAASARNAGMDAATGEFLCLVDGDDLVDKDYVNHLVTTLVSSGADMAVCGFTFWSRKGQQVQTVTTQPGIYDRNTYLLQFLQDWSCSLLWNKIFRRSIVGDLRMEEGHRVDDEYFTYQVCMNCRTVAVTHDPLYHYRLRASSAMQDMAAVQEKIMLDRIGYITDRLDKISRRIPELRNAFFENALDTLCRYRRHSKGMPTAQQELRRWSRKNFGNILALPLSLRRKLGCLYCLYIKKPDRTAEDNPIELSPEDYFA